MVFIKEKKTFIPIFNVLNMSKMPLTVHKLQMYKLNGFMKQIPLTYVKLESLVRLEG